MKQVLTIANDTLKRNFKSVGYWINIFFPIIMFLIMSTLMPILVKGVMKDAQKPYGINYDDPNGYFNKKDFIYLAESKADKAKEDEIISGYAKIDIKDGIIHAQLDEENGNITERIQDAQKKVNYDNAKIETNQKEILKRQAVIDIGKDNNIGNFLGLIPVIIVFIAIVTYGQMIMLDIAKDKGSKLLEFTFSSIRCEKYLLGKVIGTLISLFIHVGVYALGGYLLYNSQKELIRTFLDKNPMPHFEINLILLGCFVIFGVILYIFIASALASFAKKMEDSQKLAMPLTFIPMIPYFLGLMPGVEKLAIGKVMFYVPFFSPIYAPKLILGSHVSLMEGLISLVILIASMMLVIIVSMRVYKKHILKF